MRRATSDLLVGLYSRVTRSGLLDRPRPRRAFESTYLLYKRLLEAGSADGLAGLVSPGSTVIDVGANIGYFTLRFARWAGEGGRVIAIEPEIRNLAALTRRVQRAEMGANVELLRAAAADADGELLLAVTPGHPGDHHLADDGIPVRAFTLDGLVAGDARPVSLIKIDVQGAETLVLAGARRLIERHRPAIYLEVDGAALSRMNSSPQRLIELLGACGYRPYHLSRSGIGRPQDPADVVARGATGYVDVLFLPR
jgi:FkbM family methyltransferase